MACSTSATSINSFQLKWTILNELNVIFVAVYQGMQQILYVDKLLEMLKSEFISLLPNDLKGPAKRNMTVVQSQLFKMIKNATDFDNRFLNILNICDSVGKIESWGDGLSTASSFGEFAHVMYSLCFL